MNPSKPTQEDDHAAVLPGQPDAGQSQQQGGSEKSQPQPADHPAVLPAQPDAGQSQQQGGSKQSQSAQSQPTRQIGEGSYEGSREYGESMKAYLETADVKADAEAAQPASPEQAALLKKAEQEGLAHSKAPCK
jgi:hypothetical protein